MKDLKDFVMNENEDFWEKQMKEAGVSNDILIAVRDNKSKDGKVSIDMLCSILCKMYRNK